MPQLGILVASFALAGCTVLGPVAVIAPNGDILRGTATSNWTGDWWLTTQDEFAVRGGMLECRGQSDPALGNPAVTITLGCSDSRSGIGRAVRENAVSGRGTIQMNDGGQATFVYGEAARGI